MTATNLGSADGRDPVMTPLPDVTGVVLEFNDANPAYQSLWERIRQARDDVLSAGAHYRRARGFASQQQGAYKILQNLHRERTAPLGRQLAIAALTVVLDAVACWFAAQAIGDDQLETFAWAGLFLAVLASGEVALDYYRDRSMRAWRLVLAGLSAFVVGLGVLRYLFLSTVGVTGYQTARVGAVLFTAATAVFLLVGYRALRAAEKPAAWRARLAARRAGRAADQAAERLTACLDDQHRHVGAYLSEIRGTLLSEYPRHLDQMEDALRKHLYGSEPS